MAKRMDFSVVGLPHYTVWHLYEPSVDDIRHMEEMEQERLAREKEEKERADRMKKIKEDFNDPNSQWEKDKNNIEAITKEEELQKQREGDERGPNSQKDIDEDKTSKREAKEAHEAREEKDDEKAEDVKAA